MIQASLRRLSVLKAVYELGGVNAAADQLDIAQPSVTAHIQALEAQLGTALFVRQRGRRLRPTDSGEALYRYSCRVLMASEEAQIELKELQGDVIALSLGLQRSLACRILPTHLSSFLQAHPFARVSVHSETQEGLTKLLRGDGVDIGLLFSPVQVPGYVSETMGEERLVLIASPTHPLAGQRAIEPQRFEEFDFVGPLQKSQFSILVDDELRRIGIRERRVVLSLQDTASVKQAVVHGMGIACTLRSSCQAEIEAGEVVILDVAAPPMSLLVQCTYREGGRVPAMGRHFIAYLRDNLIWQGPVAMTAADASS